MAGEYRTEDVLNQLPAELAGMIRLADCASRWRAAHVRRRAQAGSEDRLIEAYAGIPGMDKYARPLNSGTSPVVEVQAGDRHGRRATLHEVVGDRRDACQREPAAKDAVGRVYRYIKDTVATIEISPDRNSGRMCRWHSEIPETTGSSICRQAFAGIPCSVTTSLRSCSKAREASG